MADQSERLLRGAMVVHARMLLLAGLVIAAGVAAPIVAAAQSATPAPASSGGTPSTAAVVTSTNDPLSVLVSDGMQHLEYDLIVTNTYHAPVRQTHTDVLVPDGTQPQRLEGEAPVTATQPILRSQPQQEIPASGTVAVVVDVDVPPELAIEGLTHTIAYGVPPDAPDLALIGCRETGGPDLSVALTALGVIAPPLSGGTWLALNGSARRPPCTASSASPPAAPRSPRPRCSPSTGCNCKTGGSMPETART